MTFKNLKEFIDHLETIGELKRVKHQVSTILEMTEIQRRMLKIEGPAILFEQVITENGKNPIPVLVNLFGNVKRVALALNTTPDKIKDIGETLAFLRQPTPPKGWKETLSMAPLLKTILATAPAATRQAVSLADCLPPPR